MYVTSKQTVTSHSDCKNSAISRSVFHTGQGYTNSGGVGGVFKDTHYRLTRLAAVGRGLLYLNVSQTIS